MRCMKHTWVSMGSPPGLPEPVGTVSRQGMWWNLPWLRSEKAKLINYRWDAAQGLGVM